MKTKYIYPIFILLSGVALIILSFLYFGSNLGLDILILNIFVSSIIFSLFFVDLLLPMCDLQDKSHKIVGSIGIRWFVTFIYKFLAVGAMIIFIFFIPLDFSGQILIQGILFFTLLVGFYAGVTSSEQVEGIYIAEKLNLMQLENMKRATNKVLKKIEIIENVPSVIISRLTELFENLRYISPCTNQEAIELETHFILEMTAIYDNINKIPPNYDNTMIGINNCERIYKARKQIFTN